MTTVQQYAHPYRIGSLVGAIGATVFVLANRNALPDPWPLVALASWGLVLALYVYRVWLSPAEALPRVRPPRPRAGLIYVASVAAMILGIQVGRSFLPEADRDALMPAVIVICVGLHLVPFAQAFRAPVFALLGWAMTAIGVMGLTAGLATWTGWACVAAVVTGIVMLAVMAEAAHPDDEISPGD
ncbi:hypothetical protein ACQBAT_14870 [Ornithinimicrobium sp. Y1847]|uniref:hypothetical protein n=1 Tax=Ornithinimicrobium sp. Y1847 TaxID=3405419 RepID=UPI003B674383